MFFTFLFLSLSKAISQLTFYVVTYYVICQIMKNNFTRTLVQASLNTLVNSLTENALGHYIIKCTIPLILYAHMFISVFLCQMSQGGTCSRIVFNVSSYYRLGVCFFHNITSKQLDVLIANQLFRAQSTGKQNISTAIDFDGGDM